MPEGVDADVKKLVLNLTTDDWARVEPVHRQLKQSWSQLLGLHQRAISFTPDPSAVLRVSINRMQSRYGQLLVEPLWEYLQVLLTDDATQLAAEEDLGPRLRAIAELPAELFPMASHRIEDHRENVVRLREGPADHDDPTESDAPRIERGEEPVDTGTSALDAKDIDALRSALEQLRTRQSPLVEEMGRAIKAVTDGVPTAEALATDITAWNSMLTDMSSAQGAPVSLSSLAEIIASADAAREAERADQALIERVLNLRFPDAPAAALNQLGPLLDQARSASLPLNATFRSILHSFVRVASSDPWDQEDEDLDLLAATYGARFSAVAARLTAVPGEHIDRFIVAESPRSPVPDSNDAPGLGVEADVRGLDIEATEDTEPRPGASATAESAEAHDHTAGAPTDAEQAGASPPAAPQVDESPQVEGPPGKHQSAATTGLLRHSRKKAAPSPTSDDTGFQRPAATEAPPAVTSDQQVNESTVPDASILEEPAAKGGEIRVALEQSDFALAYWYARASDDTLAAQASELLAISTSMDPDDIVAQQRCRTLSSNLEAAIVEASPADIKTIAASVVPAALLLAPYSEAAGTLNAARHKLGDECPSYVSLIHELTYSRGAGISTMEAKPVVSAREEAREALLAFRKEARTRSTRFHRATEVWRELVRDQGILGSILELALADPGDAGLRPFLQKYSNHKEVGRLIQKVDHDLNPIQARKSGIIAKADQELRVHISRALDVMTRYLDACDQLRSLDDPAHLHLDLVEKVLPALREELPGRDLGDVVARRVASWLWRRLEEPSSTMRSLSADEVLQRPLVLASELVRSADRKIDPDAVTVELLDRVRTRTVEAAFDGYSAHDDHVGIAELLDWVHDQAPDHLSHFEERKRDAELRSRERLRERIDTTRREIATALSATALLSDEESQRMQTRLERVQSDPDPHYPDALNELDSIVEEILQKRGDRLNQDRATLDGLTHVSTAARDRVQTLLDAGDLANAEEFIAQLSSGASELPAEAELDGTFTEFWPAFTQAASEHSSGELDWLSGITRQGTVAGSDLLPRSASEIIRTGFQEWVTLTSELRQGIFDRRVRSVMMALGFQFPLPDSFERFRGSRLIAYTTMRATYEGYAVAPAFGSGANGKYVLFLCWDRKSPKGLLDAAHQVAKGQPTVILYFHTMSAQERRSLGELARRDSLPYLVIDHAAMAFIGTRQEASLETVMRITLPFSGVNPFTPFVLGDVPREMFYGRATELRKVQDPAGPLFVYGGRQLGKSALLKTAMKDFRARSSKNVSLYVDLKAQGIGEWREADQVWRVLIEELQRLGLLDQKTTKSATGDVVIERVRTWLSQDPERHLLVLLDEADSFLDQDSRAPGAARFRNVYMLKRLMDMTARRFKPVFAGLHQVQRFHKESNGPMAHVGTEIPIGPLPPSEAYKLVTRPLAAIGYEFTSPDAVWRLLNHTNYQASLIQLFCNALVERLHRRKMLNGQPPSSIDADLIDNLYAEKEVRRDIAQRFEWTIQLDNRYRVIALTTAWLTLETGESTYAVELLREYCSSFWPDGFSDANWEDFRALLDEMAGLGVLVRADDQYGIRSPNVIRLLGSPEDIARKLDDAKQLERASSYDASRYRRRLIDGTRSPLTEAQAARALTIDHVVDIIVGTTELQADQIVDALTGVVAERRNQAGEELSLRVALTPDLAVAITALSRERGHGHLHWDAREAPIEDVIDGISRLVRQAQLDRLSCSCLVTPRQAVEIGDLPTTTTRIVRLAPWQDADLRAIASEAAFPLDRASRELILLQTGGWSAILERLFQRDGGGGSLEEAVAESVEAWRAARTPTQFLESADVKHDSVEKRVLEVGTELGGSLTKSDFADLVSDVETARLTTAIDVLVLAGLLKEENEGDAYGVNPLSAWALG